MVKRMTAMHEAGAGRTKSMSQVHARDQQTICRPAVNLARPGKTTSVCSPFFPKTSLTSLDYMQAQNTEPFESI